MTSAFANMLPDGKRLHLQNGPIDLVIEANGEPDEVALAYEQAERAFEPVLADLVSELDYLRTLLKPSPLATRSVTPGLDPGVHGASTNMAVKAFAVASEITGSSPVMTMSGERNIWPGHAEGPVARIMESASRKFANNNITPMIAVAGSVADFILAAMTANRKLDRAYVNNGGDIALYLNEGQSFDVGIVSRVDAPEISLTARLTAEDRVRGIATSGWRGRSFSLGVADAVTVLAQTAALADVAATLIANAVDPGDCAQISRIPACDLDPDSDLGQRQVTTDVQPLSDQQAEVALQNGQTLAQQLVEAGHIVAASLSLQDSVRIAGTITRQTNQNEMQEERRYARS